MLYRERKPGSLLQPFVRSLWSMQGPVAEPGRERMLPSGCAHIVLSLSRDFLTACVEGGPDQCTSPGLLVGQRSLYEIVSTADFADQAGVLFAPGALPALVGDRADLFSNQNFCLDQIWPGASLRSRMREYACIGAEHLVFGEAYVVQVLIGPSAFSIEPFTQGNSNTEGSAGN